MDTLSVTFKDGKIEYYHCVSKEDMEQVIADVRENKEYISFLFVDKGKCNLQRINLSLIERARYVQEIITNIQDVE